MLFRDETNPFFEAYEYLTKRFIKQRTSVRITQLKTQNGLMTDDRWASFEEIAKIEYELDKAFPVDDIIERYFMPLETKDLLPDGFALSIGSVLLGRPQALKGELSFDNLLDFYRSASLADILSHFYDRLCTTVFSEADEICDNMQDFITFIDGLLVNPKDKWAIMDAAGNPVRHLEALRGLLYEITAYIERRERDFSELIKTERDGFCSCPSMLDKLNSMGFDFKKEELERITICPSLISFNRVDFASSRDNLGDIYIYLGIFANRLLELRSNSENAKTYMNTLKLLSDSTRFKALHYMRNRQTFGQELADKFNCTRNTMYYHLEKLLGVGLIECTITDYRTLYTMNKRTVYEKLTSMRDYLTDGWKPEDDETGSGK